MEPIPKEMEIRIEVPRRSLIKRRPDHSIDYVSPIPSPFNYGSVLGRIAADGDPEDAVVLGARIEDNEVVRMPVWGQIRFIDAGVPDHKWVCGRSPPTEAEWRALGLFFRIYVWAKRGLYRMRGTSGEVQYLGLERFSVEGSQSS